mmetsp:Transcript_221/g.400  ORF Transcript_221/g.400 Transcript_221/m.400 type:complete len:96 (+) Transcript_221:3-290(+)
MMSCVHSLKTALRAQFKARLDAERRALSLASELKRVQTQMGSNNKNDEVLLNELEIMIQALSNKVQDLEGQRTGPHPRASTAGLVAGRLEEMWGS